MKYSKLIASSLVALISANALYASSGGADEAHVTKALTSIPDAEPDNVLTEALRLIAPGLNEDHLSPIIREVKALDRVNRHEIVTHVQGFITPAIAQLDPGNYGYYIKSVIGHVKKLVETKQDRLINLGVNRTAKICDVVAAATNSLDESVRNSCSVEDQDDIVNRIINGIDILKRLAEAKQDHLID